MGTGATKLSVAPAAVHASTKRTASSTVPHWLSMQALAPARSFAMRRSTRGPGRAGDSATEGITKESETKYTVERSVLDKYLGDIEGLSKMARAMPHKGADGSTDGYRLSGIRRNSPLYALGIRNGDVIHTVNGTSLANPADAMGAFQSLGSTSNFNFDITRRNNPVTMEYAVK